MPNLQRLAGRGVCSTQCFTPSPLCAPARACLASGRDYARCGAWNNSNDYPVGQPTFYRSLRDSGYRVGGVGKFDLHKATLDWGLDGKRLLKEWGFTDGIDNEGKLDASISYGNKKRPSGPYMKYLQENNLVEVYRQEHRDRAMARNAYTTRLPEHAYCDNWIARNGLEVLRGFSKGRPWFLQVNFAGPHEPMDVTERMRSSWEKIDFPPPINNTQPGFSKDEHQRNRQNYAAMLENIDDHVGSFVNAIRERGEEDRTCIVYSSDHGEMLGDLSLWGKSTWYHPSIHVPLVAAGPGIARIGSSNEIVLLHDLCATFIEMAAATPLPDMDALSLLSLWNGSRKRHRSCAVSALHDWRLIFDGRYKMVRRKAGLTLFDLFEEPREERFLWQRAVGA